MKKKVFRHKITIIPYQEPPDDTTKAVCDTEERQNFLEAQQNQQNALVRLDGFSDILEQTYKKAKNHLTSKQQHWCEIFLALKKPTCAAVARKLNISRVASNQMKRRLLKILLPYYQSFLSEQNDDKLFLVHALNNQKDLLGKPEYLEKRRGQSQYMYWCAIEVWNERLGLSLVTGRIGRQITYQELQNLKHLPIRLISTHKASPLSLWWIDRVKEEMSQKNTGYAVTYEKLYTFYSDKWPEKVREKLDHLCRFCRCLLPLGEVVDGRKITKRRRYCSDSCKTYSKRHRLTSFKKY